jgi:hypothetical protein
LFSSYYRIEKSNWRRCKKPFWRRKSFKRFKSESYFLQRLFLHSSKVGSYGKPRKKMNKRVLLQSYYRSNSIRKWFKTSIFLRHYWKFRYGYLTHVKMQNFLSTLEVGRKNYYIFCNIMN